MKSSHMACTATTYDEMKREGYDFSVFDYRANMIIQYDDKDVVIENVAILDGRAIVINKNKKDILLVRLSDNPHIRIERLDSKIVN